MPSWSDRKPVDQVDSSAFLFMGADPCWSPGRETKLPGAPDAPSGCCLLCGGDGTPVVDLDGEPLLDPQGRMIVVTAIVPGSHRVCARCMRSGHDQQSRGASVAIVFPTAATVAQEADPEPSREPTPKNAKAKDRWWRDLAWSKRPPRTRKSRSRRDSDPE